MNLFKKYFFLLTLFDKKTNFANIEYKSLVQKKCKN